MASANPPDNPPPACIVQGIGCRLSINPFAATFRRKLVELVAVSEASQYRIAKDANMDRPYLNRLYRGIKSNPSVGTVLKICLGLYATGNVSHAQLDELLMSAGFAPIYTVADAM